MLRDDDSRIRDPKAQVRESYNRIAEAYLSSRCRDSPDVALLDDLVFCLSARARVLGTGFVVAYLPSRCRDSPDVALLDDFVVRLPARSRVLDAGCGAGVPIAQQLAARANVVGVDFAEVQLGLARRHVPTGLWVCADLAALPFADASFDAICSYYAVIHIPREEHARVLDGFARVLRSGGPALLCLGAADLPAWTEEYHDAPMYWSHYDAATSLSLVKAAGFDLVWHRWVADGSGGHL